MTKTKRVKGAKAKSSVGPVEWYDSPREIAVRALGIAVGTILVMFIGAMLVVPKLYNGAALTVVSGSMQPALNPGDVIVVRGIEPKDVCSQVAIGNIITYLPASGSADLVTHRVENKTAGNYPDGTHCRLTAKGDANNTPDENLVSPEQVRGTFMYGIPYVGWGRDWVMKHRPIAIGALGLIVIAYYLWPGGKTTTQVLDLATGLAVAGAGAANSVGQATAGLATAGLGAPALAPAGVAPGGFASGAPSEVGSVGPLAYAAAPRPAIVSAYGSPYAAAPLSDIALDLWQRDLELREREMRLREAEAELEFGYKPPPPEPYMTI